MAIGNTLSLAGIAITSFLAGSQLTATTQPTQPPPANAATPPVRLEPVVKAAIEPQPLIAVSSYGTVTLRVEQQPLEWVLEEIGRQSGWSDVKQRVQAAAREGAASPRGLSACACSKAGDTPVAQLRNALERGTETERLDALLQSKELGVHIPDSWLLHVIGNDASDRVRLLGMAHLLDRQMGDPDTLRATLRNLLRIPNEAVRREAEQRLADSAADLAQAIR